MRRWFVALATLVMVVAVATFVLFVWTNARWTISLEVRAGEAPVEMSIGVLLGATFVFGALIGVLATVLTFSAWRWEWLDTIERLSRERRKLAAANRALEAALPVLRERYDVALGVAVPPAPEPVVVEADSPEAATLRIDDLAREDAEQRLARRRHRGGGA